MLTKETWLPWGLGAILKKSSFQYGRKFIIENGFFIPSPSLAAEKQGLGLKISSEDENFRPGMNISSENRSCVRGGYLFLDFFSCVRARMNIFDLWALWGRSNFCPDQVLLSKNFRSRAGCRHTFTLAIPAAIYRSAQAPGPESAPRSAFWVLWGTWLGVPKSTQKALGHCPAWAHWALL